MSASITVEYLVDPRTRGVNNLISRMNRRMCLLIVFFLAFGSFARAEAKAYDIVKYQGKGGEVTIVFDFGSGYPEASELHVVNVANGKTTKFRMDQSDDTSMTFVPEKGGGAIKSVTV